MRGRFLSIASILCLVAGCTTSTFQLVDGATGRPLPGVAVTRREWGEVSVHDEFFHSLGNRPTFNDIALGTTDTNGMLISRTMWRPFTAEVGVRFDSLNFWFEKPGYLPADVSVNLDSGEGALQSPRADNGSTTGPTAQRLFPRSIMQIPMWPDSKPAH